MKAREKARELVEKYKDYTKSEYVIQLTLTVVDEIIYELDDLPKIPYNERRLKHWKEVKEEINKL